jgi:hypothetical protein
MTNINKNGRSNRNHDNPGTPASQIKLRIHVQSKTYIIFIINMTKMLETAHV